MPRAERTARRKAATTTRKAAAKNGKPKTPAADAPPPELQTSNGVFVLIERTDDGSGGIANLVSVGQGDVRPAEIPTILETAAKTARRNLGLD